MKGTSLRMHKFSLQNNYCVKKDPAFGMKTRSVKKTALLFKKLDCKSHYKINILRNARPYMEMNV